MRTKKKATGAPKQGGSRRYGPLLKLAAQIATDSDGLPCSVKTVYAVARRLVKSARVSDALRRAETHPIYRRWVARQLEDAQRQFEKAKRQLREAKRLLNPEDRAA